MPLRAQTVFVFAKQNGEKKTNEEMKWTVLRTDTWYYTTEQLNAFIIDLIRAVQKMNHQTNTLIVIH